MGENRPPLYSMLILELSYTLPLVRPSYPVPRLILGILHHDPPLVDSSSKYNTRST